MDREYQGKVRAACLLLCIVGATAASGVLWGGWAALLAFSVAYGLACLFDDWNRRD